MHSLNTAAYNVKEQNERLTDIEDMDSPGLGINARTVPSLCYGRNMTFPRPASSCTHRHELPAIVTEGESCRLLAEQQENNSCSDGQLSGVMPDVAMATASFGALQLIEEQELELDLGDGTSHLLQHVSPSSGTMGSHRSSLPHPHQRHYTGPPPPPYMYHRAGTALPRFI
ncbi:BTB/POZ domain-containing protein [Apis cerana cerana]|uniref:BTB/POZ domain-containing protein n=1 Tax=Apis cerana cerana TaxID=94128 RepID=A0A2A3ESU3_APICC|nr:BTB/POZ domain-containing protein [Apis cerana cerana]